MHNRYQQEFPTRKERLQFVLSRISLIISVLILLFSSTIANYNTTVNEAWIIWKNLNYFNYVIIFWALHKEVIEKIGKTGYKIVVSLLVNYFIDQYFELKGWSWNDLITVGFIVVELIFKNKKHMRTLKKLVAKHWALIGLIAAFIVDHSFDILKNSGLSLTEVDIIKGLGVIVVGYLWNPKKSSLKSLSATSAIEKGNGAVIPRKGL
jgi:hypothetical protein